MPGKTVLVLEDEESLRLLIRKTLEGQGYTILSAGDSVAASQLMRSHSEPVDLLLSDINLPGLTGGEFAAFLKTIQTGVKVLYMSGAPLDPVAIHDVKNHCAGFIQKPFALSELVHAVKLALGEIREV